jgi:hypothetical protein
MSVAQELIDHSGAEFLSYAGLEMIDHFIDETGGRSSTSQFVHVV